MAIAFLDEKLSLWVVANTLLIILGVVLAIIEPVFEGKHLDLNMGYLYLLIATLSAASSTCIGKVGQR